MRFDLTIPEQRRFWSRVNFSDDGCWIWGYGVFTRARYGRFLINRDGRSINCGAHRLAYEQTYGPIPDGLYVCHTCDVPRCVRPDHLFAGTALENTADAFRKGRRTPVTGTRHPFAKLTPDQVREIRRLYVPQVMGYKRLGEMYGVTAMTIYCLVARKTTWKEVT